MIHKTIIVAPVMVKRSRDDRTPVRSPSGAAENSPGLQSGDHEPLQNSLSPGALMTKEGFAIPGLNALGYYPSSLRDSGVTDS